MPPLHYATGSVEVGPRRGYLGTACGRSLAPDKVTTDPGKVSCRTCQRSVVAAKPGAP